MIRSTNSSTPAVFDDDRYFDVVVEYAKAGPRDILMRVTAHNRGPDAAALHILPTVWFRNTWSWKPDQPRPAVTHASQGGLTLFHPEWDTYRFWAEEPLPPAPSPKKGGGTRTEGEEAVASSLPPPPFLGEGARGRGSYLFTDNDTNAAALFNGPATPGYFKDGINERVVNGNMAAVNPEHTGTKAAAHYTFTVPAGGSVVVRCRLRHASDGVADVFTDFDTVFAARIEEADRYFDEYQRDIPDDDARRVQRQAVAGLVWTKQFYQYDVYRWLKGDAATLTPPEHRWYTRNSDWQHLKANDILSMPDKWEYPYFCAWDTAFHAVAFRAVRPGVCEGATAAAVPRMVHAPERPTPGLRMELL